MNGGGLLDSELSNAGPPHLVNLTQARVLLSFSGKSDGLLGHQRVDTLHRRLF
jgi:hypothetical protein